MLNETPTSLEITAERLSRSEILTNLDDDDLISIAQFCSEEIYQDGQIVLTEMEPADKLFFIERGKLALEKRIQIGRQSTPRNATIDYVCPGMIAGFSGLTPPYVYSTSAICVEPTRVIAIDARLLREFLRTHPQAGFIVMTHLASLIGHRYRSAINTLTYFLSIVSHELRSPLAAVENYLQTILWSYADELSPKLDRMIKRSLVRISDLRNLIGDVVDLARMRPEQIQADFEWFDPGEVGAESIEDTRLMAAEKGIRVKIERPPHFEVIVGARRRMRQVFTNLLNNAIKFSPPDGQVIFRAWYEPDAVFFVVEDQGPGIPEEELPMIFQDFFRAENVGDLPGTGLGLSIAKKIIDAHGGYISATNLADGSGKTGTCFTVKIPRNLMTPDMRKRQWKEMDL